MKFVGNPNALNLMLRFASAKKFPNVLMTGPSGHGKTTLVRLATGSRPYLECLATAIKKHDDMYACLKQIQPDSVFFIDEIHQLSDEIQVSLYETMKSGKYQFMTGTGKNKKPETLDLPNFALCGATTHEHQMNVAFKNRFLVVQVDHYNYLELIEIAKQNLPQGIDMTVAYIFAEYCRGTPRTLVQYCETFRDTLNGKTASEAMEMLKMLNAYPDGLTKTELKILQILEEGTQSLAAIASVLGIEEDAVKDEHEPYLIRKEFIERTRAGRNITEKGMRYLASLKMPVPKAA